MVEAERMMMWGEVGWEGGAAGEDVMEALMERLKPLDAGIVTTRCQGEKEGVWGGTTLQTAETDPEREV
jgi:hypothetical protein